MNDKSANGNKRLIWGVFCACGAYFLMLILLVWAERADSDAAIQTLTDAFWYSVVTLSTVGYGDLYPVTPVGRVLGLCFVLMSVGVLSFIIGATVNYITGKLIPAMERRLLRDRPWFVFSEANPASLALAEDLLRKNPDGVCLFPEGQRGTVPPHIRCHYYGESLEKTLSEKTSGCKLFFMDMDSVSNYPHALQALALEHPVYCSTEQAPDRCPAGLSLFNYYDCCARDYWHRNGLRREEKVVLLIGSGKYARQILVRGLLMNVFSTDRTVSYHLFGDWDDFQRNHPQLSKTVAVNRQEQGMDCVFFHTDAWNQDMQLLERADRIILCSDDEARNREVLRDIRQFVPVKGRLHLRSETEMPGETVFGTHRMTCTSELVLKDKLTETARFMHERYRSAAANEVPAWEELSEFTRQSNIATADHLLVKLRILMEDDSICAVTPELCREAGQRYLEARESRGEEFRFVEHLRWMRFHSLYNWRYGPVRNNPARIHPLMVPYEELSPEEQRKDDFAWELILDLAETS